MNIILLVWLAFTLALGVHSALFGESEIEGAWRDGLNHD